MICGHCKYTDADIEHVKACAEEFYEDRARRSIDVPTTVEKIEALFDGGKVTEDGIYRDGDGEVFKVQWNQQETGLYAKRLIVETDIDDEGKRFVVSSRFVFEQGAIRHLTTDMRLSLDEAKAFGKLYGICVKCGAKLTNEDSIAAGIGPICAEGF